ncbi:hypothetical protein F887_01540 [Acinetobacter sp. NIPH 2100]|nr:hypothetical protein F887_01540 [Acinetobacter sp. NIPH 2100]
MTHQLQVCRIEKTKKAPVGAFLVFNLSFGLLLCRKQLKIMTRWRLVNS